MRNIDANRAYDTKDRLLWEEYVAFVVFPRSSIRTCSIMNLVNVINQFLRNKKLKIEFV